MCNNNRKLVTFDKKSSSESMEEYFDRISDANYERIDREFMDNLKKCDRKLDRIAFYEKIPRFFYGFFHGCLMMLVGALFWYFLAVYLFGRM